MLIFNKYYSKILEEFDPNKYKGKEPTPELIKKCLDLVSACKIYIYNNAPFISAVLQKLQVVLTTEIPTMAVDNYGNIYINPFFGVNEITKQEFLGVIIHECFHIINHTFDRQRGRHPKIWNYATDYIMNRDIIADGYKLPSFVLLPDADGNAVIKIKDKEYKFNITKPKRSAEWLYKQIISVLPPDSDEGGRGDEVSGEGDEVSGEGEQFDKHIDAKKGESQPKPVDGTPGPQKRENIDEAVRKAIEDAKVEVERRKKEAQRGTGEGGSAMSDTVITLTKPLVDWRAILKDLARKVSGDYTWARPAKRALASGYYAPRRSTVETIRKICLAIDSSGSIGLSQLNQYVSEVINILKIYPKAQFVIVLWASDTYYHVEVNQNNIDNLLNMLQSHWQTGGNDTNSIWRYIKKHNIDKDLFAIVIVGDGGFTLANNIPSNITTIYMIDDPWGADYLQQQDPKAKVYRIKR